MNAKKKKLPVAGTIICPDKKCRTVNGNWRTRCRKCKRRLHPAGTTPVYRPDGWFVP